MAQCPVCMRNSAFPSSVPGLHRCRDCDHIFQRPLAVTASYNYQYVKQRYEAYATTDLMSHLRLGFMRAMHPKPGRLLDVGYGNGSFLKLAAKAKYDTFGNDVHGCGEQFGVRDACLNGDTWDVITFFDSLEHFPDLTLPRQVCKQAVLVIVSIPCRPEDEREILSWKHYRPGEHLHYFSPQSLSVFMEGKQPLACLDLEDTIRGDRCGQWNILTSAWK